MSTEEDDVEIRALAPCDVVDRLLIVEHRYRLTEPDRDVARADDITNRSLSASHSPSTSFVTAALMSAGPKAASRLTW